MSKGPVVTGGAIDDLGETAGPHGRDVCPRLPHIVKSSTVSPPPAATHWPQFKSAKSCVYASASAATSVLMEVDASSRLASPEISWMALARSL